MITVPENEIVLPNELQIKIEKARNNVTIMEGEFVRLKGLVTAETYTINELAKQKAELNNELEGFEARSVAAKNELETVNNQLVVASDKLEKMKAEISELTLLEEKIKERNKENINEINTKNRAIEIKTLHQEEKAKELLERENVVIAKEEKFKSFLLNI